MGQIQLKGLSPQQFRLELNGALIGTLTLTRKGVSLLGQPKASPRKNRPKRKRIDSPSAIQARELLVKANQLGKAYRVARAKWHSSKGWRPPGVRDAAFSEFELRYLKRAVSIMQACGVTNYHVFIKSQLQGLKNVNGGKGIFPSIQHLATDGAELRLLTYLKAEKDEDGNTLDIDISADERNTPLTENGKYMTLRDKVLMKEASRAEALYVMTLQVHRTGKVKPYVTEYIEQLNKAEVEH